MAMTITLSKAGDFTPPKAWIRNPGAGSQMAQRQRQREQERLTPVDRDVLSLYEKMPTDKLYPEGVFVEPYDVVKGLGLPYADEVIWTHRVGSLMSRSPNELALRKGLMSSIQEADLPNDIRHELARRTLVFWRSRQEHGFSTLTKGALPPPKPPAKPAVARGPQPGKRGQPQQAPPTGKPKMMGMSAPGQAPPSIPDQQGPNDPNANPVIDTAGVDEEPQDPQLLKNKVARLVDQLHSLHPDIAGSVGHIHMHNEIKELLRALYKNPTPEGVREAEHQVAHFSALVQGAPDVDPNAIDPNDPNAQQQPAGGPQFRQPTDKPGQAAKPPMQKGVTLSKAFDTPGGGASTAIARPTSAVPAKAGAAGRHGEGSRGGHIVGHTPSGAPIYANQHVTGAPQAGEGPQDTHARLKQQLMDAAKALHEHEAAHGMPSSFGGGQPQLGGQAPGWTSPTAQTVIRGQQAAPKVTLNAAAPKPALPASQAPAAQQAGPSGTQPGRRMTSPQARGQAAPGQGAPPSEVSEPVRGDIEDSKQIATAVAKDGYVGKTSTGKDVSIGADTSKFSPDEMHEAAQLHRAAQQHLLAAANATGKDEYRQAAKKHLNEEFRLTSDYVSHQGQGGLGSPMQKGEWHPLEAWGPLPFFRVTLLKAEYTPKGRIKLSEAQRSALEIHVEDPAHDDDEDRVRLRGMIQGEHFVVHPGDDEGREHAHTTLSEIGDSEEENAEHAKRDPESARHARAAAKALHGLAEKVRRSGQPKPAKPKADPQVKAQESAVRAAETASSSFGDAGRKANESNDPEHHAAAAHAGIEAANAWHDAHNTTTAERVETTAQKHMAAAGAVYIGPRGGKWRNAAHTESVKKGAPHLTLVKAFDGVSGMPIQEPKTLGNRARSQGVTLSHFSHGRGGEGSRGGHIIGHTRSGKPIYETAAGPMHAHFTPEDHEEAAALHQQLGSQGSPMAHATQARTHRQMGAAKAGEKAPKPDWNWPKVHFKDKPDEELKVQRKKLLEGNLGIPRIDMPQIQSSKMMSFLNGLHRSGVGVVRTQIPVSNLKATQSELHKDKVLKEAKEANPEHLSKPVVVSNDGYLLDGHHRWAALHTIDPSASINALHVDMPIDKLVQHARAFGGASFKKGVTPSEDAEADPSWPGTSIRKGWWPGGRITLEKAGNAERPNHKYTQRVARPGGGFRYIYGNEGGAPAPAAQAQPATPKPKRRWVGDVPKSLSFDAGGTSKRYGMNEEGIASDPKRAALHEQLIHKMVNGGEKAPAGAKPHAIVMMGGPASGKSAGLKHLDTKGFAHVDPDWVKEQLPEFQKGVHLSTDPDGTIVAARGIATAVHEESSLVAKRARKKAIQEKRNLIIDGSGHDASKHGALIDHLHSQGYHVHLLMPHQERETAHKLAANRADEMGRHVPAEVINKAYDKIPYNFMGLAKKADRATLLDVSHGFPPKLVYSRDTENGETDYDKPFIAGLPQAVWRRRVRTREGGRACRQRR